MSATNRGAERIEHDFYPTVCVEIPGYPGYFAGFDGHVYSKKGWRGHDALRLSEGTNKDGYATVQLNAAGRSRKVSVHRLVCAAFKGDRSFEGFEVRHLDGNKGNNAASNLEWGTAKQNADDRETHGRTARGRRNKGGGNKLDENSVKEIRASLEGGETHRAIANRYGISIALVGFVKSGRLWRHV